MKYKISSVESWKTYGSMRLYDEFRGRFRELWSVQGPGSDKAVAAPIREACEPMVLTE